MALRGIPSPPGRGSGPSRTNNLPEVVTTSVSKTVDLTDYALLASLQAQLAQAQAALAAAQAQNAADAQTIATLQAQVTSLQAQVSALQAQAVIDAATIASLQAQVTSLQAQVTSLQNYIDGLGLDKLALFKTVVSYSAVGGGIYVPPSYSDVVVSYNDVVTLSVKTLTSYTTVGGGFP